MQLSDRLGQVEARIHALNNVGTSLEFAGRSGGHRLLEESLALSQADLPAPRAAELAGDFERAAGLWFALDQPYEGALSLMQSTGGARPSRSGAGQQGYRAQAVPFLADHRASGFLGARKVQRGQQDGGPAAGPQRTLAHRERAGRVRFAEEALFMRDRSVRCLRQPTGEEGASKADHERGRPFRENLWGIPDLPNHGGRQSAPPCADAT
nr:hypothetical protein [Sinirhodobacter populi]